MTSWAAEGQCRRATGRGWSGTPECALQQDLCRPARDELSYLRTRGMPALADQRMDALKKRFCDLSLFVKEVKERFSRWFNKQRGRKGTLWMDRFKSVLVEAKGEALRQIR